MSKHPSPQETEWPEGAVFTVGHSTLPIERFIALLLIYGIKCLADIRTVPRSRHNPQFNGDALVPKASPARPPTTVPAAAVFPLNSHNDRRITWKYRISR